MSKISKYDILREYMYNEMCRLEGDVQQLQENIKWRRVSTIDCLELIIAQERLSAFCEFKAHVSSILKLRIDDDDDRG